MTQTPLLERQVSSGNVEHMQIRLSDSLMPSVCLRVIVQIAGEANI